MVETVRFELTDPFGSTVFKTVAINQTRPRFHIYGGTRAVRTPDQRIKSPLLYRLSYGPVCLVRPEGLEPPTPYFVDRYSNPLSYGRILKHT